MGRFLEACQSKFNFCSPLQASTSTMPAAKEVFIAVIGAGGVGKCFLSQLEGLSKRSSSKLSLIFVSRSKTALYSPKYTALPYDNISTALADSKQEPLSVPKIIEYLSAAPAKVVLVDNTSSQDVADAYPDFLAKGISIVTPNKKAFSGSYKLWQDIFSAASTSGAKVYHESSVGAGLPVISTLKGWLILEMRLQGSRVSSAALCPSCLTRSHQRKDRVVNGLRRSRRQRSWDTRSQTQEMT